MLYESLSIIVSFNICCVPKNFIINLTINIIFITEINQIFIIANFGTDLFSSNINYINLLNVKYSNLEVKYF